MIDFEKWFMDQDFYTNMRFIYGDALFVKDGFVYRVLPVQMTYLGWASSRTKTKDDYVAVTQKWFDRGRESRQEEIDQLKAEKDVVLKLAKQWQETARQLSITDDKHVICSLLGCAEEVEEALRGEHE